MNDLADLSNRPRPPLPLTREQVVAWLDYQMTGLVARRDDVLKALDSMLAVEVADAEVAGVYAENVRMATSLEKSARAEIDAAKRPYLEGGRAVDGWRLAFVEPLTLRVSQARQRLLDWENAKIARAREQAQIKADAIAAQAAEDAARARKTSEQHGLFSPAASVLSEQAEASALQALRAQEQAQAKPADLVERTVGRYGSSTSVRRTWTHRLVDLAQVPLEYHALDAAKVAAAGRDRDKSGRPTAVIPGIEWVEETSLAVR
jgi:hypothetical protein